MFGISLRLTVDDNFNRMCLRIQRILLPLLKERQLLRNYS